MAMLAAKFSNLLGLGKFVLICGEAEGRDALHNIATGYSEEIISDAIESLASRWHQVILNIEQSIAAEHSEPSLMLLHVFDP